MVVTCDPNEGEFFGIQTQREVKEKGGKEKEKEEREEREDGEKEGERMVDKGKSFGKIHEGWFEKLTNNVIASTANETGKVIWKSNR